tara:strand:- start:5226 stop:7979 length:2754 start_codon:yes stop_codon:yes gene_type:complete
MAVRFNTLDGFLQNYKTKDDDVPTHTKIGDIGIGIYGGSYCIPDDKMKDFYKLYHKETFIQGKSNYLTEVQLKESGAILIDIDERYSADTNERQHTNEHIIDLINLYVEKLREMIVEESFNMPVYVFEKEEINKDNQTYVKDGIHIILAANLQHDAKVILRNKVKQEINIIFEDLPLINSYEEVMDFGVARGKTNWQLLGSRKPNNEPYKLKNIYNIIAHEDNLNEFELDKRDVNMLDILPKVSARNKELVTFELKQEIKDEIQQQKNISAVKAKPKITVLNADFNSIVDCQIAFPNISSKEECEKIIKFITDYAKQNNNYDIKFAHDLTMVLNENYYNPYENWIKTCWCLRGVSKLLYPSFLLFSSQSEKFVWGISNNDAYEEWNDKKFNKSKAPAIGSLKFWARECDPEAVNEISEEHVDHYLYKTLSGCTEWDIAKLVYALYRGEYKCVNIKQKVWYEYKNGRWSDIDSGTSLRQSLSHNVSRMFHKRTQNALEEAELVDDEDIKKQKNMDAAKLAEMALNLKKTTWKQNIMRECCEVFFDKHFLQKLDTNKDLLCFNNGVMDFKNKEFRRGDPNDYVSLCTNTDYVEIDDTNEDHIRIQNEINEFMEQLFPNPNLNNYMWQHLASILRGGNKNQTFNIYTGSGRNGKSKLVELMGMVLGDYKGSVPLTLITRERTGIGNVSPEVAQLVGVRYAVMQEPSKATKLNEGPMKELVGEDPIQCRALFKDAITFVPQFKLVVCTNHLFDIQSTDDGTWRRIRVCDFVSKFIDNPSDNPDDHQFKIDRDIDKKFKEWVPIFTSMLVKKVFETEGYVQDCDEVMAASQKYKEQQDHMSAFIKERIQKHETGVIKKSDVKQEFEDWYTNLYSGKVPSGKELYEYLSKALGPCSRKGWTGWTLCHSYDLIDENVVIKPNNV